MIPKIKDKIAKINFPEKRITIAIVMKIKDTIKKIFGGILFRDSIIYFLKYALERKLRSKFQYRNNFHNYPHNQSPLEEAEPIQSIIGYPHLFLSTFNE
tara:strand:+ start:460 stop:756 length:297 start_codon:yes stop_codon:yes gene_type:complete